MRIARTDGTPEGARARILAELTGHAAAAGHPFRNEHATFEAWDGDTWLGGLVARFGTHWVFVELLSVAASARGRSVGRELMQQVEDEARSRGLAGIWLDTYSFQAPGFYRRLGFTEFGRIDDYPPGQSRIFLQKRLA